MKTNKDRGIILSTVQIFGRDCAFRQYKVSADIRIFSATECEFFLPHSLSSSVISGQLSVLLPCCPALLYVLLHIFNCFIEQINE